MDYKNFKQNNNIQNVNLHAGHRKRVRRSLVENNWTGAEEHKVLEYMLMCILPRKDTNPIAHRLIDEFGSFAGVLDASIDNLKRVEGVGESVATFLASYIHIFKYYKESKVKKKKDCSSPANVFNIFGETISHMPNEELYLICVDSNSKLIASKMLSRGTNNEVSFVLKGIIEMAVKNHAAGVVLLHNHPNLDPTPSNEDLEMTKRILFGLYTNDIEVLDHIIVSSQSEYYSFARSEYLNEFKAEARRIMGNIRVVKTKLPEYNINDAGKNVING